MPRGLRSVRSYALYYGMGGEDVLAFYDLAIVDPAGRTAAGVKKLKQRGAIGVAYLSVLEVPRTAGVAPPTHVLKIGGQPVANEVWNNWILDPAAAATRDRLMVQTEQVLKLGYDGAFLDCVGDVEDRRFSPEVIGELVPAAGRLVDELRRRFGCLLVQNWGLHHLLPYTAPLLDGVCWEDFPYDQIGPVPAVHSGIRRMQEIQTEIGCRVLALNQGLVDPAARATAASVAERCNFLWYGNSRYIDLPPKVLG